MRKANKILSLLLAVCLVLGMIPLTTAAAESDCTHTHGPECTYVDGAECGQLLSMTHDENCGWAEAAPCGHEHDEACGEDEADCPHVHDEDCGYTEAAPCEHKHDEACGYIEAIPCGHVCGEDCGVPALGNSGNTVTFTIAEEENGLTALYLPEGIAVTDADLLAGVTAEDENGDPVTVTVKDTGGLDLTNPQRPDGVVFPNIPYTIFGSNRKLHRKRAP